MTQAGFAMLDTDAVRRSIATARMLTDAALANPSVRDHLLAGRLGWSEARVRRSPPVRLVFEFGELGGDLSELAGLIRYAEKRKLGTFSGVAPLRDSDVVHHACTTVLLLSSHPRRARYIRRGKLKARLTSDRAAIGWATRMPQARFIVWIRNRPGLSSRIRAKTHMTVKELWRAANK